MITGMVTKSLEYRPEHQRGSQPAPEARFYFPEWFDHLGLEDAPFAKKLGVTRQAVFRWRKSQRGLTPDKIIRIARAMGIAPQQLWMPPGTVSVDAILQSATEKQRRMAVDMVERIMLEEA